MLKLIKNNFKTTNDCIILATPLIIFLSILGWYLNYALDSIDNIPKLILAVVTTLVMSSGFFSAWFYMTKKTLKLAKTVFIFDKDRAKAFRELILSLPKGIGKLFLPFLGIISISGIMFGIVVLLTTIFVTKYIGTIDITLFNSENVLISTNELITEIRDLSNNELVVLNCWYLILTLLTTILSFIAMLWIPEVVYTETNPFRALIQAVKKLFITLPKSFLLFLYVNVLMICVSVLNTLLMYNPILYFFVLVLYYYLFVYIVVLIFTYYEQTFLYEQ